MQGCFQQHLEDLISEYQKIEKLLMFFFSKNSEVIIKMVKLKKTITCHDNKYNIVHYPLR